MPSPLIRLLLLVLILFPGHGLVAPVSAATGTFDGVTWTIHDELAAAQGVLSRASRLHKEFVARAKQAGETDTEQFRRRDDQERVTLLRLAAWVAQIYLAKEGDHDAARKLMEREGDRCLEAGHMTAEFLGIDEAALDSYVVQCGARLNMLMNLNEESRDQGTE